ncbi:hypothetical protein SARC_01044 [Sphaeroforma arctica JP610]|uniref:Cytochrome b-c1 complex subunit 7 n=1 Tax=Sphaeroforma arctica JP610 TaxID=667725 RepID=A0A0L0GCS0_9EUKA|nr:hypothetical protein SARC_01044 [Sphaeroforma arctica JP610]KNC86812.1 hypothetical protein SARC_01044 [Sphaeroforma arctica JP610]|eukprot:XP_014160714.1 hypothetical protein SARC_01044 [Sphaeroforma arctica JP610]
MSLLQAVRRWAVNKSGYRKYGLRYEDICMEEANHNKAAIARLSSEEQYDRKFRMKVALDLSAKHAILPKELWTTDESDKRYLSEGLKRLENEHAERAAWDNKA